MTSLTHYPPLNMKQERSTSNIFLNMKQKEEETIEITFFSREENKKKPEKSTKNWSKKQRAKNELKAVRHAGH